MIQGTRRHFSHFLSAVRDFELFGKLRKKCAVGKASLRAKRVLFLTGYCTSKEEQLPRVAKDWCMTIRANHVIPVSPFSKNIQPDDMFLVHVPIDCHQIEEGRGLLQIDNHIARLAPTGYTFSTKTLSRNASTPTEDSLIASTHAMEERLISINCGNDT